MATATGKLPTPAVLTVSTLQGKADPAVVGQLRSMVTFINQLQTRIAQLEAKLAAQPPVLTMDQIQQDLQASGTHPLNVTGLRGTTTP